MPKISLTGPAELLTIIPFHLGFQPERSVVVVCFHGKRLGLVARLDLVDEHHAAEAAAQVVPTLLQDEPSSVAVVGFEDVPHESLPLIEALTDGVEADRVVVRERLVLREGRWWSVGCDCCPDEGWLLPEQADVPAVAGYVALGHAVLPAREELARLVEPLQADGPRHDLAVTAIEDWQRRYRTAGGSVSDRPEAPAGRRGTPRRPHPPRTVLGVLDGGAPTPLQFLVNDSLVAWGGVLRGEVVGFGIEHWLPSLVGPLRDVELRDALIGWLCPGTVSFETFPADLVVMLDVLLGPHLRLAPAAREDADRDGFGRRSDVDLRSGDEVASRLTASDLEALQALHALLDLESSASGRDLDEAVELVEATDPGLEPWPVAAADGGPQPGESWEEWDEASVPREVLGRLEQVCRLTPAVHAAPVLSVVASVAWWCGDGARAGVAVDQALALEPDHRLSQLLRQSLDHGIRPSRCA